MLWFKLELDNGTRNLWFSWRQVVTVVKVVWALRKMGRDFGLSLEVRK